MDGSGSLADSVTVALTNVDIQLEQEFEARVTECATLTFRLAYSVLRHRQEAEDVAQEALAKAYRNFSQLRDRELSRVDREDGLADGAGSTTRQPSTHCP